jgi:hypothetical protein
MAMAVVAPLAYIISAGIQHIPIDIFFLTYCSVVCGLTGFAIGWTFPEEYRLRKKATVKSHDHRIHSRVSTFSAGTLQVGKEKYPCQTVDLSMEGAKLATVISDEVGTNVLLNLNDIGTIHGIIKRKDEEETSLQLFPDDETKKRLEAYIGLNPALPAFG